MFPLQNKTRSLPLLKLTFPKIFFPQDYLHALQSLYEADHLRIAGKEGYLLPQDRCRNQCKHEDRKDELMEIIYLIYVSIGSNLK